MTALEGAFTRCGWSAQSALSDEARRDYQQTGFVIVRGVFLPEEVSRWAAEADTSSTKRPHQ